ncbi:Protein C24D10.6, partial [Aphelenchoides avenae]
DAVFRKNVRSLEPRKYWFYETIPLCSTNKVDVRKQRVPGSSCTQELQALFSCLKKWEYDDIPCKKFHVEYMRCAEESKATAQKYKEAAHKGALGDGEGQLTTGQFNRIMQMFPQPQLGQAPYRKMKRLPTQSYADDVFNRMNKKGKKS